MSETSVSPIHNIVAKESPITSLFFSSEYQQSKTKYLEEIVQRTWGPKKKPLWTIQDRNDFSIEKPKDIIQASLRSFQDKIGLHDFQNLSRSFRYRCGENHKEGLLENIESTYILFSIQKDFLQFLRNKSSFLYSINKPDYVSQNLRIVNIHLLVANIQQSVLIIDIEHTSKNVQHLIEDIHPFQKSLFNCYISLRENISEVVGKENIKPKDTTNYGYLSDFVSREEFVVDPNPCPIFGFWGWLLFQDWKCPETITERTRNDESFPIFTRLIKSHFLYRMHSIELSEKNWENHRDEIVYYLRRGARIESSKFISFDSGDDAIVEYSRNWDHDWSISKDSIVSIAQYKNNNYSFAQERFLKGYQILAVQVVLEYTGCQYFNQEVTSIAYFDFQENSMQEKRDRFLNLIQKMHQFRLGVNLVDFSTKASESLFYASLRKSFNIDMLLGELNDELEDVHAIINELYKREEEFLQKQRKEELEIEKEKRELFQQNQERILSIFGAITIPFALIGGLLGMNTNIRECGIDGRVPCITFWETCMICVGLAIIMYLFFHFLWRETKRK